MKRQKLSPTLADVVTLVHTPLLRWLEWKELSALLVGCGDSLTVELRDVLATKALFEYAEDCMCHFEANCMYDLHQLVPNKIEGVIEVFDCSCMKIKKETESTSFSMGGYGSDCDHFELPPFPEYYPPTILPLPHILDARAQLREAARHSREISRSCGSIFQLADLDDPEMFRFGTFQPMFFSLTTALEAPLFDQMPEELKPDKDVLGDGRLKVRAVRPDLKDADYVDGGYFWEFGNEYESESEDDFTQEIRLVEKEQKEQKRSKRVKWLMEAAKQERIKPVDANNVQQLKKLLNKVEKGLGTRFCKSTKDPERLSYGILEQHWNGIDVNLSTQTTRCKFCASVTHPLLPQHCQAVFQPLKKYMLRHLKHVRYVRPTKNWRNDRTFEAEWYLDLIAGFTPSGVLCGVYLTDLMRTGNALYGQNIAEGGIDLQLDGEDDRLLRRCHPKYRPLIFNFNV